MRHSVTLVEGKKLTKPLNTPFRTPEGPKKFAVYVKDAKGRTRKVNFGDPKKKASALRDGAKKKTKKDVRDEHRCEDPGPRWKAKYWSCRWT